MKSVRSMCGRFAIGDTDGTDWADWLGLDGDLGWPPKDWPTARWNIAPTQSIGIVVGKDGGRRAGAARWGLVPSWWRQPLSAFKLTTFNARSEEADKKPVFRDSWSRRRCLIPAIGWYEWAGEKGAKQPWYITVKRNTPGFWFAGLWSRLEVDGAPLVSCTILTTDAGAATRHLHPRVPVVLGEDQAADWLAIRSDPKFMMVALPDDRIDAWPVGKAVGKVAEDYASLLEPVDI